MPPAPCAGGCTATGSAPPPQTCRRRKCHLQVQQHTLQQTSTFCQSHVQEWPKTLGCQLQVRRTAGESVTPDTPCIMVRASETRILPASGVGALARVAQHVAQQVRQLRLAPDAASAASGFRWLRQKPHRPLRARACGAKLERSRSIISTCLRKSCSTSHATRRPPRAAAAAASQTPCMIVPAASNKTTQACIRECRFQKPSRN